ncbi:MAG: Gfo/Idh/MocA family oxidoreductase [Oceanipulchritudo sp.]
MDTTKKRIVLVGCGGISRSWLGVPILPDEGNVVGFVDLDVEQARKRAAESPWPEAETGSDLEGMLKRLEPEVVFDCTVPSAHKEVTLTALRHGCHVLGEKPMATTLGDAREMVRAADKAGRAYAVVQNRRHDRNARALQQFLRSGAIGRLTEVHVQFMVGAHFGGFRAEMEHVLLGDMAIHTFDTARMLCGKDPLEVTATEWNPPGSWYRHGASANAVFRMTEGLYLTYTGSWCAHGAGTGWEAFWRIIGERGGVVWDGGNGFVAEEAVPSDRLVWESRPLEVEPLASGPDSAEGHHGVMADFLRSLRTGNQPETHCRDNIQSLAMVTESIRSVESGRAVTIEV